MERSVSLKLLFENISKKQSESRMLGGVLLYRLKAGEYGETRKMMPTVSFDNNYTLM